MKDPIKTHTTKDLSNDRTNDHVHRPCQRPYQRSQRYQRLGRWQDGVHVRRGLGPCLCARIRGHRWVRLHRAGVLGCLHGAWIRGHFHRGTSEKRITRAIQYYSIIVGDTASSFSYVVFMLQKVVDTNFN